MGKENKYTRLIAEIFKRHYKKGLNQFSFGREELETAASCLGVSLPKNLGDVLYSSRFRNALPQKIQSTAPKGKEWIRPIFSGYTLEENEKSTHAQETQRLRSQQWIRERCQPHTRRGVIMTLPSAEELGFSEDHYCEMMPSAAFHK